MTNKELRRAAFHKIEECSDGAAISTLYFFTSVILIFLAEQGLNIVFKMAGYKDYSIFSKEFYHAHTFAWVLLWVRVALYGLLFSTLLYLICRNFISFTYSDKEDHTRRFLSGHIRRLIFPCVRNNINLFFIKLLTISPALVSAYFMVDIYRTGVNGDLAMWRLFCFMLATGFTLIWSALAVHYHMSLCLVPYIIELNPRASFFAVCDLSVKLMDGNHVRMFSFMISLIPSLLSGLLIYPMLIIYPYITECKLLFAHEIMGDYWQDKIPAMARRWEKQMARMENARTE